VLPQVRERLTRQLEDFIKGSITEGKLADLVILDRDPRTVEPEDLHTLHAALTMIDGRVVYKR